MRLFPCHWLAASMIALAGCAHSDAYQFGELPLLGPLDEPLATERITWNPLTDAAPSWSRDGASILYIYNVKPTTPGAVNDTATQCIGMVPRRGGTRTWSMCDTRSVNFGGRDLYTSVTFTPDDRLLFLQTSMRQSTAQLYATLVIADTADPLGTRHEVVHLPMQIGDSVVQSLTDLDWTSATEFIAVGHRIVQKASGGEIFHLPRMLVRGTLTGTGVTLSKIAGTDNAATWTTMPDGSILFVRGRWFWLVRPDTVPQFAFRGDSIIERIPPGGGTPTQFAAAPFRLTAIECAGARCLVHGQRYVCNSVCTFDPYDYLNCATGCSITALEHFEFGAASNSYRGLDLESRAWQSVRFDPTATQIIYVNRGNLIRRDLPSP